MNPLQLSDLNTTINHEPRIKDIRLAETLGFEAPLRIRSLIDRHAESLARFGVLTTVVETSSAQGGRPGRVFWLNKRQALFLCTKSEAPLATEATVQMVEVFDAYLAGRTGLVPVRAHRRHRPRYLTLRDLLIVATAARKRFEAQTGSYGGASAIHALHDEVQTLWDKEGR